MKIARLTPSLSVAPQLTPDDVKEAAAAGFKSIINNRPDGESSDQPGHETIAAAAKQLGLDYRYIPIVPGQLSDDKVEAFARALGEMQVPTLAFCRSGTRSTTLWALASAGQIPTETILTTASEAGYDLEQVRPRVEASAQTRAAKSRS